MEIFISKEDIDLAPKAQEIARMVDMLPDREQDLAFELVKRMVLAWDPDFTKVTPEEAARIKAAEESGFVAEEDVDWNNLGQYSGG